MPKRMKSQRRGKSKPRFVSPSHRYMAAVSYPAIKGKREGEIMDIINDPARGSPLSIVQFGNHLTALPCPNGVKVGDMVYLDSETPRKGDIMRLKDIPEGTQIFNIEITPGDGGKMVRGSGTSARVMAKEGDKVVVKLPSRKIKRLNPKCRATIGAVAGAGRKEKPVLKAGKKHHMLRNKTRTWPIVAGGAMNAVDHPFGGGMRRHKKRKTISRRMPPGKKVGSISAKRTGRKRGKK